MNIFAIEHGDEIACPIESGQNQCDKHVVKMPLESAQMLCTAHRILDGYQTTELSKSGRNLKTWKHSDPYLDKVLYKSVHDNHPCSVWARESESNYNWLYDHFISLCIEYKYRYEKDHGCYLKLVDVLKTPPKNIPSGEITPFKLAMNSNPECMFPEDPVKSYRMYYKTKQDRFKMVWTKRQVPGWFTDANL